MHLHNFSPNCFTPTHWNSEFPVRIYKYVSHHSQNKRLKPAVTACSVRCEWVSVGIRCGAILRLSPIAGTAVCAFESVQVVEHEPVLLRVRSGAPCQCVEAKHH